MCRIPYPPILYMIPYGNQVILCTLSGLSQSMKALQSRHLTPAQGREKKKILGCWPVAKPPANTPNPDFEKALCTLSRLSQSRCLCESLSLTPAASGGKRHFGVQATPNPILSTYFVKSVCTLSGNRRREAEYGGIGQAFFAARTQNAILL
jgi:hypothetical protein